MSENRKSKYKSRESLMRSADQKRLAWEARGRKNREQAIDQKRILYNNGDNNNQHLPCDLNTALHHLALLSTLEIIPSNKAQIVDNLAYICHYLTGDANARSQVLLEQGLLAILNSCLQSEIASVQFQAAKCITCIASGDHDQTSQVFAVVPSILILLRSTNSTADIKTQLCWALGNIAVDCNSCKGQLVALRCPQEMITLLLEYITYLRTMCEVGVELAAPSEYSSLTNMIANLLWSLTNMVRGHIEVPYMEEFNQEALGQLVWLCGLEDDTIAPMARWIFTFLTSKDQTLFDRLLSLGLYEKLVERLAAEVTYNGAEIGLTASQRSSDSICAAIEPRDNEGLVGLLRSLGNICAGSESYAQQTLTTNNLLPRLIALLDLELYSKYIAKEALRTLSYVLNTATEEQQKQYFHKYFKEYMTAWHHFVISEDYEIQEAALLAIEPIHPDHTLAFYMDSEGNSLSAELSTALYCVVKLLLSPHITGILCQLAALQLLNVWIKHCPQIVGKQLVQLDVAESLENLQYTSEDKHVTGLAEDVLETLYKYMEECEVELDSMASSSKENQPSLISDFSFTNPPVATAATTVFSFGEPVADLSGHALKGAGRGAQATQPSWMMSY